MRKYNSYQKHIIKPKTMLKTVPISFKGLILISGPTKSGKSKLAEFLIKEQESVTYIATSKPRKDDKEWQRRIMVHKKRRPITWKFIEHPTNICDEIESINKNESVLIDSLGGLVEQHLMDNEFEWDIFQNEFINCLISSNLGIIIVSEEIGWGLVPSSPIGHLFRERHSNLSSLLNRHSHQKWLALNGIAINLNKIGHQIP